MLVSPLLRRPVITLLEWAVRGLARVDMSFRAGGEGGKEGGSADAGTIGERAAYFHLRRLSYIVVARRWRAPNLDGEIDLIAWQGETLCFVEVKTRTAEDRFAAAYVMDPGKRDAFRRMARAYVQDLPAFEDEAAEPEMRFDRMSVYLRDGVVMRVEHDRDVVA